MSTELISSTLVHETVRCLALTVDQYCTIHNIPNLIIIGCLKGALPTMVDLCKNIKTPFKQEFVICSSYEGTTSTGNVNINLLFDPKTIKNTNVLIVEDIVDTGRTLSNLVNHLKELEANEIITLTLLDKPSRREVFCQPTFVGITIPDAFVIGYGLDYNQQYRGLDNIIALDEQDVRKLENGGLLFNE